MSFNQSFLEDEVRLGFYIPSSIKQAWAAELEVLEAIDRVCAKCNIKYFADWGTLLGAVRHSGFIPWDDDLDLVMLREDYDMFLKKAPSLLPKGYTIHTFRNEEGFKEFHAVVINTEHPRFDEEHFKTYLNKLVEWSEQDYDCFEKKFTVIPSPSEQNMNVNITILYFISTGVPFQNLDCFIDKVTQNMKVFCSYKTSVNLILGININLISTLTLIDTDKSTELEKLLNSLKSDTTIRFIEDRDYKDLCDICDAYYGDVSPMVCEFSHRGKPIMIQDYTL